MARPKPKESTADRQTRLRRASLFKTGQFRELARDLLGLPPDGIAPGESVRDYNARCRVAEAETRRVVEEAEGLEQQRQNRLAGEMFKARLQTKRAIFPGDD